METKKELRERIERLEKWNESLRSSVRDQEQAIVRLAHHFGIAETYTRDLYAPDLYTPEWSTLAPRVDVEWIMDDLQKIAEAATADKARARLTPHAPETKGAE